MKLKWDGIKWDGMGAWPYGPRGAYGRKGCFWRFRAFYMAFGAIWVYIPKTLFLTLYMAYIAFYEHMRLGLV